ncbi:MAG: TonB-dependent receptor [Bacteroidota bacterium]
MLHKLFPVLIAFYLGLTFQASAQQVQGRVQANKRGSLQGRITDEETGKPLAGASLYFPDLRTGAAADSNGQFKFNYLPVGNYIIDITYQGFASLALPVVISGETSRDFTLNSTVAENDNVTVTGVSKATSIRVTPIPVSVVRKQDLYRSSANNIIEALTRKSGVSALTTGPAVAKPVIRGLGYNRVVTLSDGMRQEGQQWGDEHGIEIDEYSVQRAEILRGPASLMYGSDAIGGVLNIQSYIPVPENVIRANLSACYNGNNQLFGSHADISGKKNGFIFSASASTKNAGDYRNRYDGRVLNSRFKEADFGATIGINRNWGYSHLVVSNFDQHIGIIEGDRDQNGRFLLYSGTNQEHAATNNELTGKKLFVPNQQIQHFKLALDNNFNLGNGRLSALIGFQHNKRQEFGEVDQPNTPESFFDLKTINYNIAYHFAETKGWKMAVGVSGMQQENKNKAEEALIPDYALFDAGGYFFLQKNINSKLVFTGGVRLDNRHLETDELLDDFGKTKFEALSNNFANFSASAGASYLANDAFTFKANISRAFRAPGVAELTANGEHEGTNRFEIGTADLKSETSLQGDLAIEYNASHISFSLTPYINRISNYIFLQKLQTAAGTDSMIVGDNGDLVPGYKFNQQTATLGGLEFSVDLHPHPLDWLHFENSLSYVKGRFTQAVDGSKNLPMIAPLRLLSELRAEWAKPSKLKGLENLYFKVEMDASQKQSNPFTGYSTETVTAGYALINAGIGTDLLLKKHKWASFHFSFNNVFDKAYQSHLSRLKYTAENQATGRMGVFNMGRNFTARCIIPLEFKLKS